MSDADDDKPEFGLILPSFIDTEGYTDRDREMFTCGMEWMEVTGMIRNGWRGERPIHRENSSRFRMAAAKWLGVRVQLKPHDETWDILTVETNQ